MRTRDWLAILFAMSILAGIYLPRLWQWYRLRRVLEKEVGKGYGKFARLLQTVTRNSVK